MVEPKVPEQSSMTSAEVCAYGCGIPTCVQGRVCQAPPDLWDECGETLWIRADLASTGERAKRIAFAGHDPKRVVKLPETLLGGERHGYDWLDVTTDPVPLRGEVDGWNAPDLTYCRCEADDPRAVLYWMVTCQ